MPASASSASPEIVKRNGAPGTRLGIQRQPLELGLESLAGTVAARAVARRLLVELGLQHRQVQRRVLGDRMVDDRLDAGRQPVLHAVRHVGAEPRGREHRRPEAAAAGSDAPAVGRRLPARQPAQPGVHCLADLGFERPLHAYNGSAAGGLRRFRGIGAAVARRSARDRDHSSNSSSHGHRGRPRAGAHQRDPAPRRHAARRRRPRPAEPRRRDPPGDRRRDGEVGAGRPARRSTRRRDTRGSVAAVVHGAPQNDGCGVRSADPEHERERRRSRARCATIAGHLAEAGRLDDVLARARGSACRARRSAAR